MKKPHRVQTPLFADKDIPELLPCQLCGRQLLYVVLDNGMILLVHGPDDWCLLDEVEGRSDG